MDGTYDRQTLEPVQFEDGYQVGLRDPRKIPSFYETYLGVWQGKLELSIWVKRWDTAVVLAVREGQSHVWDWAKGVAREVKP